MVTRKKLTMQIECQEKIYMQYVEIFIKN